MGDVRGEQGFLGNGGWLGWADAWFHCVVGLLGSSGPVGPGACDASWALAQLATVRYFNFSFFYNCEISGVLVYCYGSIFQRF